MQGDGELTLAINVSESTHTTIQRLISENPVLIFTRPSCYMCDVTKRLFYSIGVYPTVIELDDGEIEDLVLFHRQSDIVLDSEDDVAPAVFIGGFCVGGLENVVALHLSGHLVARLVEIGVVQGVVL
ncbi:hypothetical protein QVD17_13889 [Tagetes erecta]|uniref:Glutaredoxin domain-containing protein n=1 Tax=Tagetes erecta TaxID=13708 RepID=A0AAD8KWC5_TARER|nr:hypothetical protein QVD17_13889 [Tagetes erecta]